MLVRSEVLSIAIAVVLLAGLLLPVGEHLLDFLIVCSVCLTVAVLLAASGAKQASELATFPLLVAVTVFLRLGLAVAAVRRLSFENGAGAVLPMLGALAAPAGRAASLLMCLCAAGAMLFIWRSARRIRAATADYSDQTLPIRQAAIEARRNLGTLDGPQAGALSSLLEREVRFYGNMQGLVPLLRFDAIGLCVLVAVAALAARFAPPTDMDSTVSRTQLAAGVALITLLPAVAVSFTSVRLMTGKALDADRRGTDEAWGRSQKVTIVSETDGRSEQIEVLNPDFINVRRTAAFESSCSEAIAQFEPPPAPPSGPAPQPAAKYAGIDAYYDAIAEEIVRTQLAGAIVLLASSRTGDLPVTVPVNAAIRVASRGLRTVLVDLDARRRAIAEAFDLPAAGQPSQTAESGIVGLSVWTGGDPGTGAAESTGEVFDRLAGRFDRVVVYAPALPDLAHAAVIAARAATVVVFRPADGTPDGIEPILAAAGRKSVFMPPLADAV